MDAAVTVCSADKYSRCQALRRWSILVLGLLPAPIARRPTKSNFQIVKAGTPFILSSISMSNPSHPVGRVVGLLIGAWLVWRSIVDDTLKAQTFIIGAGAIFVCLFRWNRK